MPDDVEVPLTVPRSESELQKYPQWAATPPDPEYLRGRALELAIRIIGDAKGDHGLIIRAARDLLAFIKEG